MAIRVVVLTVGDRYLSGANDECGEILDTTCRKMGWELVQRHTLGDSQDEVVQYLCQVVDSGSVDLVFTVDGIGILEKDHVPEAMYQVCEKWIPGLAEIIRVKAYEKTPTNSLTRGAAGIRGKTLIINLPGTPTATKDALDVLKPVIRQAVEQVNGPPR